MCVCFNSSEITGRTNVKLDTVDYHPMLSVTKLMASQDRKIFCNFEGKKRAFAKIKILPFGSLGEVIIND